MATNSTTNVDLKNISEAELEIVVQVIQKDFELKAGEKARLRRHRRQLKDYDKRVSILSSSNFNENFCVICFQRFIFLLIPKRCCYSCRHLMCNRCSVWIPVLKSHICMLCQKERNLKSMGCDWYYGVLKNKFQQDGSEIVAQSLYNNQGQYNFIHIFYRKICYDYKPEWIKNLKHSEYQGYVQLADSIITPDLLKKVKGAQISRYREKIHSKWEEMQKKLNRLDRTELNKSKKNEAWQRLVGEYQTHFRDILKEFSQFLYITLENIDDVKPIKSCSDYAAKVDDPNLNINEQVIKTVYDEIELLIGYRLNYIPEEMGSILSDVESTASLFIGSQMEEKLANALVNKIIQDHSLNELKNYGVETMDDIDFQEEDQSSNNSYSCPTKHYSNTLHNGAISGRSSTVEYSAQENDTDVEIMKYNTPQYYQPSPRRHRNDSESTIEIVNESRDIVLSVDEIENVLRYSKSGRQTIKHIIERNINVPYGEPLNLQFQLNGISEMDILWTKAYPKGSIILDNTDNIEVNEVPSNNLVTYSLKIWQTTTDNAGLYIVLISNQPFVEYTVNITENKRPFIRPSFRLKMLNCNCRTGQIGEFSVEPLGYPEPRISFYHYNKIITPSSGKYRIDYKEQISRYILKILSVTENDHGTYRCIAINSSGSCECSAQLQVTNVKFRFGKEIQRYSSSSNSSLEKESLHLPPDEITSNQDIMDLDFSQTDGPLHELVEIHQHLMYLEWQLDWFEEQTSQEPITSQNTFVGREIPDEIKIKEKLQISRPKRPIYSFSTENLASMETKMSRNMALKSGLSSMNSSNSNISRLKQIFEQPYASSVPRNSSISGRSPRPDLRRSYSPFTREVRIPSQDSTY